MKKIIKFIPTGTSAEVCYEIPQPSVKLIPEWFKNISQFSNGDTKMKMYPGNIAPNITIKKCTPFLDALTVGYMATLTDDVFVSREDGVPYIRWRAEDDIVTTHTPGQFKGIPIPNEYDNAVFKWVNDWRIELPSGFSAYFTHPSNRFDLPFQTLSGFVDADKFTGVVQFPFFIRKDFEGIISAGTPICQIIPVKREKWKSERGTFDNIREYTIQRKIRKSFHGNYKKLEWQRKTYD